MGPLTGGPGVHGVVAVEGLEEGADVVGWWSGPAELDTRRFAGAGRVGQQFALLQPFADGVRGRDLDVLGDVDWVERHRPFVAFDDDQASDSRPAGARVDDSDDLA